MHTLIIMTLFVNSKRTLTNAVFEILTFFMFYLIVRTSLLTLLRKLEIVGIIHYPISFFYFTLYRALLLIFSVILPIRITFSRLKI